LSRPDRGTALDKSEPRPWRVDLIRLTATSDHRDGEWLRVHRDGFFVAEVRTVAELAGQVDLAELEEALRGTD
jgi:hypothetical protein